MLCGYLVAADIYFKHAMHAWISDLRLVIPPSIRYFLTVPCGAAHFTARSTWNHDTRILFTNLAGT